MSDLVTMVGVLVTRVGVLLMLLVLRTLLLRATESLLAKDPPSRFFFLGGRCGVSELGVRLRPDNSPDEP